MARMNAWSLVSVSSRLSHPSVTPVNADIISGCCIVVERFRTQSRANGRTPC